MKSFQGFILVALAAFVAADDGRPKCPEHQVTVFRKPYPGDCKKYWECYQGASYVVSCPPGLEFNAPLMQCDIPEIAKCDHSGNTSPAPGPTPTTHRPQTSSSSWKPDPLCPYPSDEIYYFNYPGDCNKFYECYQGNKYVKACPAGLYWSQPISRCDYPENVHTCNETGTTPSPTPSPSQPTTPGTNPSPTPSPSQPTTQSTPVTPDAAGKCPYSDSIVFYPYPGDCNKFYECVKGSKYVFSCQANLYWNPKISRCDYPDNVDCKN